MDLIIDVGANSGEFGLDVALRNSGVEVLAIEPIPELCEQIETKAFQSQLRNVKVSRLAIAADEQTSLFHVTDRADQGVSSLLDFDHESINRDDYWKNRQDLHFDRTITVDVKRLDSLPEVAAANRIRFIKIDAQGMDLQVLESLGRYLPRVEAGMLEVPATLEFRLYAQECNDLNSTTNRLLELGFQVYAVKPNDHASNEFNLFFCRVGLDHHVIEQELHLRGVRLYDGKHYWHSPSNKLESDGALSEARTVLDRLILIEAALERECAETKRLNDAVVQRDEQIKFLQALGHRPR